MDREIDNNDASNGKIKLLFIGGLAIQILAMGLIGFGVVSVTEPVAINNTILGTLIATLSVFLLFKQTHIQRKQADIEEKMLRYETEPVLEVVNKDIESNNVQLEISNYGHGVAVNLELCCYVQAPDVEWFKGRVSRTPIHRLGESGPLEDSSIRPQEEPADYIAETITVGRTNEDSDQIHESVFETVVGKVIDRSNSGNIQVSLWITAMPKIGDHEVRADVCEPFTVRLDQTPPRSDLQTIYEFQQ